MSEIWTGSKKQRDALREKFGGRCAYCGSVLDKMQADHMEPIHRVTTDPYGRRLKHSEAYSHNPERNVVANMMPACPPCNNHKHGYKLEEWRALLSRCADVVAREKSIFRAGVRFGLIEVNHHPVIFYFEKWQGEDTTNTRA